VLEKQVVVLAHGAVDDVLDRDHAGHRVAPADRLEHLAEAPQWRAPDIAERREHRILRKRPGLSGVGDKQVRDHRGRV